MHYNGAKQSILFVLFVLMVLLIACNEEDVTSPLPDPEEDIYKLPVVVHILHKGEPIGVGHNLSTERIERQIEILNEGYRRKEGTRGHNEHPDGNDAKIEFVLAGTDPDGNKTNGIVRINIDTVENKNSSNSTFDHYAYYSYWNPENYINIWTLPLDESFINGLLGLSTGPETDLPGNELLPDGEPFQAAGILINSYHFGETSINSKYNLGRTLTHEMGHYLGLLHLWGDRECATNDYCDDTPPVTQNIDNCSPKPSGCDDKPVMVNNYMTWASDECVNLFTNDQIKRMHYVLENSTRRKSLLTSIGLKKPE